MKRTLQALALLAVSSLLTAGAAFAGTSENAYDSGIVSADGAISLPQDFREDYVLLGAWSVIGDADTGSELGFHIVYAPKSSVESYRQTGAFPVGTALVKELFASRTDELTTGTASSVTDTVGYFVMIKDDKGRFPGNPLWGDGWGWAFFAADATTKTATKDYKGECLACHEPARGSDLVYIQAYPVLR